MHVARLVSRLCSPTRLRLTGLAGLLALGLTVAPSAQAPANEEDFDKLMKEVGATAGSLRKNMEGPAADAVAADARKMVELQKNNAAFWTARQTEDAAEWATAAMNHAAALDKAATGGDMAAAAEHLKLMMGTCGQCHTKYRDKSPDGGFVIKKG